MNVRIVTSPANEEIKFIRSLEMRKNRRETGLFVVEGLRHCIEGVECGWTLEKLVVHSKISHKADIQTLIQKSAMTFEVNDVVLEKLSHKDNPQQVIGVFKQQTCTVNDFNEGVKCLVALEQVRDPGNLGTIMRTIDSVDANGVILIDQCCDPFSPEATRASMGSVFAVPVAHATRNEFIAYMKNWKGTVVGTHLSERTVDYREVTYKKPVLLVMGNEQAGLTPELSENLPTLAKLPMQGRADSLNLAIATGVMLYKIFEK